MRKPTIALAILAVAVMGWLATGVLAQQGGQGDGQPGPRGGHPRPGDFRHPPNPLLMLLDADKDGEISAAEIDNAASVLKALDKNKDGKLTPDELRPAFGRMGPGQEKGGFGGPPQGPPQDWGPPGGGRSDRGPRPGVAQRGGTARKGNPTDAAPIGKSDVEKKILAVLDDLDKNQRAGMMNVPTEDGRLLRLLAESIGAKQVVEVGTSNGYSGIWLCLALQTTGGKLTTYEIDAGRARLARENFKRAGVDSMVTLVEGDAHQEITKFNETVDLVFLDADKTGYIDYLNKILPKVRPGGLIMAHNMVGSADPKYVQAITTNPDLETLFLHMEGAGMGVTVKKR